VIRHDLDARLSAFELEPLVAARVLGELRVLAGVNIGLVTRKEYSETETMIRPERDGGILPARPVRAGLEPQKQQRHAGDGDDGARRGAP
jgi:hypothetical protein